MRICPNCSEEAAFRYDICENCGEEYHPQTKKDNDMDVFSEDEWSESDWGEEVEEVK
jgi:predicted amidophosphoribosyltransferase